MEYKCKCRGNDLLRIRAALSPLHVRFVAFGSAYYKVNLIIVDFKHPRQGYDAEVVEIVGWDDCDFEAVTIDQLLRHIQRIITDKKAGKVFAKHF